MKPAIAGFFAPFHIGAFLLAAARARGIDMMPVDIAPASRGSWLSRQVNWRLRGRRPPNLDRFSNDAHNAILGARTNVLLTTGIAPFRAADLHALRDRGVRLLNYSTDDPWNPAHRAPWFLEGLRAYHTVFTPRKANLPDFAACGCNDVRFLPFAYAPEIHHPALSPADGGEGFDVLFYGDVDRDRVPFLDAVVESGMSFQLRGANVRSRRLRSLAGPFAQPSEVPALVAAARVTLIFRRKANRDDHAMRSYEAPAMGAVILAEDTEGHRELYGEEGAAACYFNTPAELVEKARHLCALPAEARLALRQRALESIRSKPNTYADRLDTMLAAAR